MNNKEGKIYKDKSKPKEDFVKPEKDKVNKKSKSNLNKNPELLDL